jgi:glycosyltransferase involved in cell wall biosynthesis
MPEAGGPNTRLINPTDIDEIAWGIEEIIGDSELRGTMILAGTEHAKRFSGQVVTNQIFDLYKNEIHKYR